MFENFDFLKISNPVVQTRYDHLEITDPGLNRTKMVGSGSTVLAPYSVQQLKSTRPRSAAAAGEKKSIFTEFNCNPPDHAIFLSDPRQADRKMKECNGYDLSNNTSP